MKKFIIAVSIIVVLVFFADAAYYRLGWYIDLHPSAPVTSFVKTDGKRILMERNGKFEQFEIKGVNLGSAIPGEWSTDYAIDHDTYLRWFGQIKEMGANTIRVHTMMDDEFYNALYDYNKGSDDPLWVLQGVWINDYMQNSHRDAYDSDIFDVFLEDSRTMIDAIHGNKKVSLGRKASSGSGSYLKDVSPWVIGYILGVEWESVTVAYTDNKYEDNAKYDAYKGEYLYTTQDASPFEVMLARVGDKVVEYESNRYKTQKLIAFSNYTGTDPFDYPEEVTDYFMKCAKIDVEHIKTTDKLLTGQFASYHVYPSYPAYLDLIDDWSPFDIGEQELYSTADGGLNTYRAYLTMLARHHDIPVVISEFGIPTGRGIEHIDANTHRDQGNMTEREQGEAIVMCCEDIKAAGCAGCCVFLWQDEWWRRTPNTMYAVDLRRSPYWSDYQTNGQYFGLLTFDPGEETSVCYVDGDLSEWKSEDIVAKDASGTISAKYDEKFIYFLIHKNGMDLKSETLYVPLDVTPKSGSSYCSDYNVLFDSAADFLLVLDGTDNSRLTVQKRYEALRSTYAREVYGYDAYLRGHLPEKDDPGFVKINMLINENVFSKVPGEQIPAEVAETGKLTHGNANPESPDFNSLADFMINGSDVEIRLPWQLLNFADPSLMLIHDDYYEGDHFGIEYLPVDHLKIGASDGKDGKRIVMSPVALEGWDDEVTYHERLKSSYYVLQSYWSSEHHS